MLEYPLRKLRERHAEFFSKLLPSKLVPFDVECLFETTDDGILGCLFLEGGKQSSVALHKFRGCLAATSKRESFSGSELVIVGPCKRC